MNWEAIFWFAATVLFVLAETVTVTLVSIWFAAGALVATIVALLGGSLMIQVTLFLVVATALLLCLRPMVRRFIHPKIIRTNVDSVVGAVGIVTTQVNNISALGQVKINGLEWSARSTTGSPLKEGAMVKVDRVEGVKVFVSLAEEPAAERS